jgi:hypothetical protein
MMWAVYGHSMFAHGSHEFRGRQAVRSAGNMRLEILLWLHRSPWREYNVEALPNDNLPKTAHFAIPEI